MWIWTSTKCPQKHNTITTSVCVLCIFIYLSDNYRDRLALDIYKTFYHLMGDASLALYCWTNCGYGAALSIVASKYFEGAARQLPRAHNSPRVLHLFGPRLPLYVCLVYLPESHISSHDDGRDMR